MIPRYKYKLADFGREKFSICDDKPVAPETDNDLVGLVKSTCELIKAALDHKDEINRLKSQLNLSEEANEKLSEQVGVLENKLGRALAAKNRYKGKCEVLKDDNRDCKNEYLGFQKCAALIK